MKCILDHCLTFVDLPTDIPFLKAKTDQQNNDKDTTQNGDHNAIALIPDHIDLDDEDDGI